MSRTVLAALVATVFVMSTQPVAAADLSGEIAFEGRLFPSDALDARQQDTGLSVAFEPEFYHDWADGDQRFVVVPFVRWDLEDSERTHVDVRELYWRRSFADEDLYIGLRKVFWGVTESVHLVDIVNQTDQVENLDGEDKLGQPMIQLTLLRDWGTLDLFLMSSFRERTFAGSDGRLRPPLPIADESSYEADLDQWQPDLAFRWSQILGDYDIGVGHFFGTSREPRLEIMTPDNSTGKAPEPKLVPHYDLLNQTNLDLQLTRGDWLAKLEAVHRDGFDGRSSATVAGLEYTLVGLLGNADLGIVAEGQYDSRDGAIADHDIAIGGRFTFNDAQDTDVLAFTAIDADNGSSFTSVETNRRWRNSGEVRLEARFFSNVDAADPIFAFRRDDYVQVEYVHFF
jgi:hypothetical protein